MKELGVTIGNKDGKKNLWNDKYHQRKWQNCQAYKVLE